MAAVAGASPRASHRETGSVRCRSTPKPCCTAVTPQSSPSSCFSRYFCPIRSTAVSQTRRSASSGGVPGIRSDRNPRSLGRREAFMLTRRAIVEFLALGAAGVAGVSSVATATSGTDNRLGSIAAVRDRLYGCAATTFELRNAVFAPLLAREARILVAEYEVKRAVLEPRPRSYDFAAADVLLHFAARAQMKFRGHTLVWHRANPPWLVDALPSSRAEALLTGYITAVAGRYRGRMHSWDVVNEALAPADGRSDRLRESIWLKAFGP